jgi:opacity protein-like surface antigen
MKRATVLIAVAVLLAWPGASSAQTEIGIRGFADAGLTVFTAMQSFRAILGTPSGPVFGGGVEVDVTQKLFISLAASRFRRTGQRVFVFQDQVFKLDVADTITVTPLQLSAAYRFDRVGRFTPYAGGGMGWYRFGEVVAHSTSADDVTNTHLGYHVLAGAATPVHKWLGAAVDAQWSSVPNAIGDATSSVGKLYDEHNLGGFTFSARVIIGR